MKPHVFFNWLSFWILVLLAYAWMLWRSRPRIREGKGVNWKKVGGEIKGGLEKGGEVIKDTAQDGWSATEKGLGRAYDYSMDYVDQYGNYFSADMLATPINGITNSMGKFVGAMNGVITSVNDLSSSAANLSGNIIHKLDSSKPAATATGGAQLPQVDTQTSEIGGKSFFGGGGGSGRGIMSRAQEKVQDAKQSLKDAGGAGVGAIFR